MEKIVSDDLEKAVSMSKDYSKFNDDLLLRQYSRISNKVKNITLKKIQVVLQQYNEQRLQLANILIQFDKRGMVQKVPQDVVSMPINTAKKNENIDTNK